MNNKIKNILEIIGLVVLGISIWYLPFSFIKLEINFTRWTEEDRLFIIAEVLNI